MSNFQINEDNLNQLKEALNQQFLNDELESDLNSKQIDEKVSLKKEVFEDQNNDLQNLDKEIFDDFLDLKEDFVFVKDEIEDQELLTRFDKIFEKLENIVNKNLKSASEISDEELDKDSIKENKSQKSRQKTTKDFFELGDEKSLSNLVENVIKNENIEDYNQLDQTKLQENQIFKSDTANKETKTSLEKSLNDEIANKNLGQGDFVEKPLQKEKLSPLEEFLRKQKELMTRIESFVLEKQIQERQQQIQMKLDAESNLQPMNLLGSFFENMGLEDLPNHLQKKSLDLYKNLKKPADVIEAFDKNIELFENEKKENNLKIEKFQAIKEKFFILKKKLNIEEKEFLKSEDIDLKSSKNEISEKIDDKLYELKNANGKMEICFENLRTKKEEFLAKSEEEQIQEVQKISSFFGRQDEQKAQQDQGNKKQEVSNEKNQKIDQGFDQIDKGMDLLQEQKTQDPFLNSGTKQIDKKESQDLNKDSEIQILQNKLDEKPLSKVLNEQQNLNNIKESSMNEEKDLSEKIRVSKEGIKKELEISVKTKDKEIANTLQSVDNKLESDLKNLPSNDRKLIKKISNNMADVFEESGIAPSGKITISSNPELVAVDKAKNTGRGR